MVPDSNLGAYAVALGDAFAGTSETKNNMIAALEKMRRGAQLKMEGLADLIELVKDTDLQGFPKLLKEANAETLLQQVQVTEPPPSPTHSSASSYKPATPVKPTIKNVKIDGKRKYVCSECGHVSGSHSGAKSHIIQKHTQEKFECPTCAWSTSNADSYSKHLQTDCEKSKGKGKGRGKRSAPPSE